MRRSNSQLAAAGRRTAGGPTDGRCCLLMMAQGWQALRQQQTHLQILLLLLSLQLLLLLLLQLQERPRPQQPQRSLQGPTFPPPPR